MKPFIFLTSDIKPPFLKIIKDVFRSICKRANQGKCHPKRD